MYANVNYLLLGMAIEGATGRGSTRSSRRCPRRPAGPMALQDAESPAEPLSAFYASNPALPSGAQSLDAGSGCLPSGYRQRRLDRGIDRHERRPRDFGMSSSAATFCPMRR